jgi:quercetin dioxygenase-like cupin family protein
VQSWNLREIETPGGSRSPVVLRSENEARAVLVGLEPGQELREHEVKERAWVVVVEGAVRIEAGDETVDGTVGTLVAFDPEERHAISAPKGAKLLLLLAPWPGEGHYRGGDEER